MLTRRREFLVAAAVLGISGAAWAAEKQPDDEDVSAIEDLMREHGVLRRILLIYEECVRRLRAKRECRQRSSSEAPSWCGDLSRTIMKSWKKTFSFPSSRNAANSFRWSRF